MFKRRGSVKILAVASHGGHWVQLMRLRPAFGLHEVAFCCSAPPGSVQNIANLHYVPDANLEQKWRMLFLFVRMTWLILRLRPKVIITTGAAPGLAAIAVGRVYGARTMWLDSVANAEQLSGSGKIAKHFADVWLTQWEDLCSTTAGKPLQYWGTVL